MSVRILIGDVREKLAELPDESVHCVVTSPPYWGLRDYGVEGQIGCEATYQGHVGVIVDVFRSVRRVLRKDGTLWLNYGDCYATSVNGRSAADTKALGNDDRTFRDKPFSTIQGALKPKDLAGMPWRVALALQEDGWWLRRDIIWHKPNAMPESIADRPATAHEYLFLLTRSARYCYDAEAVKERAGEDPGPGIAGWAAGAGDHTARAHQRGDRQDSHGARNPRKRGVPPRHAQYERSTRASLDDVARGGARNLRSVWTIATALFPEAHFATFPPALVEPCIKAGCPEGGTVLDPFGGAGTTGLVADRLKRNAILIELNPAYAEMARRRIEQDAGMFANVAAEAAD